MNGRPFDRVREAGWAWLVDLNIDQHMICAIVDVAHLVATHFLKTGDVRKARAAAETALAAAPYETIPKLDLAAVTHAEGHTDEARRIVREEVCNVADESGLPDDLSDPPSDHRRLRLVQAAGVVDSHGADVRPMPDFVSLVMPKSGCS